MITMPMSQTYPGGYIEEFPGVYTITVASMTAFAGYTKMFGQQSCS